VKRRLSASKGQTLQYTEGVELGGIEWFEPEQGQLIIDTPVGSKATEVVRDLQDGWGVYQRNHSLSPLAPKHIQNRLGDDSATLSDKIPQKDQVYEVAREAHSYVTDVGNFVTSVDAIVDAAEWVYVTADDLTLELFHLLSNLGLV